MTNGIKPRSPEKYEEMILDYVKQYPSGITITDISKGITVSRITVNKYVLVLEAKEQLFSKTIGAYKLYFATERRFIPKRAIIAFYQGLLSGIAAEISAENKESIFKNIGLNMDKFITFPVGSRFPKEIRQPKNGSYRDLFEYYAEIYDSMDYVIEEFADIKVSINDKGNKAIYTFKDVEFLEREKYFIVHFYIVSGMIQKTLSKLINKKVICKVEKVYGNNVDLSIEILK
ncbi:MAG: hypothetical protein ACFFHV_13920 [Promethearchaeota archaeon]